MICLRPLHVSEAGSPAAAATSDDGPLHLPLALKQNARCSAARGDPAGMRLHPKRGEIEQLNFNTIPFKNIVLLIHL